MATRRSKIKTALSKSISSFIQEAQKEKSVTGSKCEEGESVRSEMDKNGAIPTPNLKQAEGCSEQKFMPSYAVEIEVITQQDAVMYQDDQTETKAGGKPSENGCQDGDNDGVPTESDEKQKSRPLLRRKIKPKIPTIVPSRTTGAKPTSLSTVEGCDKELVVKEQGVLTVAESVKNGCVVEDNVDAVLASCTPQESTKEEKSRPAFRRKIKPNITSNVVNKTNLVIAEPQEDATDNFKDTELNISNSVIFKEARVNDDMDHEQYVQNEDQSAIIIESAEVKPISKPNGPSFRRRVMKPNLVAKPVKSETEIETSGELAMHKMDAIQMETISNNNIANPDDSQAEDGAVKLTPKTPVASPFRRRSMTPNIGRKSSKSEDESTNEAPKIQSRVPIKPNSKIIVLNNEILEFAKYPKPGQSCEEMSDITLSTPVGQLGSPSYVSPVSKQQSTLTDESRKSDSEYSAPLSPTKLSRPRMRPNPLGVAQRYRHTSASESEDESRKSYRQRNDSVCSATSTTTQDAASISDGFSPQKPKEYNSVIQRKCRRSEQSRKLAEAKHDFALKFGSNKPDRKKLTMIDLIFYNPTTNLMGSALKKKEEETAVVEKADEPIEAQQQQQEEEQEPDEQSKSGSDEENEMPAPQLKIGPDGQLVIDERSLKVESKSMKKDRQKLEKAKIIDDGLEQKGLYKRAKRSKDWNKQETLKFYRALNTIGTDFTLMCELFPRRTRRELKMKFKKEERMNLNLVNRAIMEPCGFDFNLVKHEADMEEKELVEIEKQKQRELEQKKEATKKRKLSNSCSKQNSNPQKVPKIEPHKPQAERKKSKNLDIMDVLDSDDDSDDVAVLDGDSDSDMAEESILQGMTKPTRSGRVPKIRDRYVAPPIRNQVVQPRTQERRPGSLTVMTTTGPDGQPVYKVFMNNSKGLENLFSISAEISSTANGDVSQNGEAQVVDDNNMTIPADENVTIPAVENVTIPADENITIPADENITIPADENITIPADENITIPADENLELNLAIPVEKNVTIPAEESLVPIQK